MSRSLLGWGRASVGLALTLAVLVWRLGTGPFIEGVRTIDGRALAAAAAITALATVCCAWRWKTVARGLGIDMSLPVAVAAYYRSLFLNVTLPGGVVGDVHRGSEPRSRRARRRPRATGCRMGALRWTGRAGRSHCGHPRSRCPRPCGRRCRWWRWVSSSRCAVLSLLVRGATGGGSAWARCARTAARDIRDGLLARRAWLGIALASALIIAGHTITFLLAARTAGTTAPLSQLLPIALLAMMAMVLPNVAGWGPREGVTAWAFGAAGLGRATRGRHRGRLWRDGARRQPARAPSSSSWHGSVVPGCRRETRPGSGKEPPMPDRPYTLLSCGMSIDGYLGNAAPRRLELSNDADFDRVDEVRASSDAILVGADTVRRTTRGCWCAPRTVARRATARGLPPSPIKVTVTERMELDPYADFFTAGDDREARLLRESARRRRPLATRNGGDRRRRWPAGEDAPAHRGPRRARRAAADGRGRWQGAHPVSHRQPRR